PLPADDVDLDRVVGRPGDVEVDAGAPGEDDQDDAQGDERPGDLQPQRALDAARDFVGRAAAVADGEDDHEQGDQPAEGHGDRHEERERAAHAGGERGAWLGVEGDLREGHGSPAVAGPSAAGCRRGRAQTMKPTRPSTVSTPHSRTRFMTATVYWPVAGS